MALGFSDAGWFHDCMILLLQKEPVKLSLAALAIAFIKISITSLTPVRSWRPTNVLKVCLEPNLRFTFFFLPFYLIGTISAVVGGFSYSIYM